MYLMEMYYMHGEYLFTLWLKTACVMQKYLMEMYIIHRIHLLFHLNNSIEQQLLMAMCWKVVYYKKQCFNVFFPKSFVTTNL